MVAELEKVLDYFLENRKFETPNRKFFNAVLESSGQENFKFSSPWTISWQVISKCNLRCRHCFFEGNQELYSGCNDLSSDALLGLADEIIGIGTVAISITGGEPLLRKEIFELLEKLKQKNLSISLQTNATLVTDSIAEKLGKILNPDTDFIQVSVDGSCPEVYDKIRGEGVFNKAYSGIKKLLSQGIKLNVNTTVTSLNYEDLPNIYRLCNELGVKKFSVSKFLPYYDEQNFLITKFDSVIPSLARIIDELEESSTFFEMNYRFHDFTSDEKIRGDLDNCLKTANVDRTVSEEITCHKHNTLYISSAGNAYLCFSCENEFGKLGNYPEESLQEIWENRNKNIFFTPRLSKNAICKKCRYFSYCKAGCMGYAYSSYGSIDAPDGFCEYAKQIGLV